METETETNMKICIYWDFIGYILVNPFTSCVTDRYLPQQYITMQTNKRIAY